MNLTNNLTEIQHICINVSDIKKNSNWYLTSFECELVSESNFHATLRFKNIFLTLTLPSYERGHIGFVKNDAAAFGELADNLEGGLSTAISDPTGNMVEIVKI
mgnify:CR=1 FL=1